MASGMPPGSFPPGTECELNWQQRNFPSRAAKEMGHLSPKRLFGSRQNTPLHSRHMQKGQQRKNQDDAESGRRFITIPSTGHAAAGNVCSATQRPDSLVLEWEIPRCAQGVGSNLLVGHHSPLLCLPGDSGVRSRKLCASTSRSFLVSGQLLPCVQYSTVAAQYRTSCR